MAESKLDPEHVDFVLQQLAEGYHQDTVLQRLYEEYGIQVNVQTIKYHANTGKERVLEKRRALINQLDRLPRSAKFVRLLRLDEQEARLLHDGEMDGKAKERLLLDNSEQVRKEHEGFKGSLSLDGDNPFEALASKADLLAVSKKLEEIKKKQGTAKMADKEEK